MHHQILKLFRTATYFMLSIGCMTLINGVNGQFDSCDFFKPVTAEETFYLESPGYGDFYPANINCRWAMYGPEGYFFYTNCYDMLIPSSSSCSMDRLEISLTGRTDLADASKYCGGDPFIVESESNKLVMALRVSLFTYGGRFKCQITALKSRCQCGRRNLQKIVGGQPTLVNEFPMMVGVVDLVERKIFCGATIISNRHLLTAGHCLTSKSISKVAVLVGDHDYVNGNETPFTKLMLVSTFTIHKEYSARPVRNDIALIRTREEIQFNGGVSPVCLPFKYSEASFEDILVDAVGWGTTEFSGPMAEELQKVELTVISNANCSKSYPTGTITSSHVCTFSDGKDSCQSDSGGPIFYTHPHTGAVYQVGIISFGVGCATQKPSVSTRITSYLSWIKENTPGTVFCDV